MPLVRVRGRSMVPALRPGEWLWVSSMPVSGLSRGAIVFLRRPSPFPGAYLKRLVGLPNEQVQVRNARLFINGNPLEESYVDSRSALEPKADASWALGPDDYIVLGDARDDSLDSRGFGPVHAQEIIGTPVFRLWPPWRFGLIKTCDPESR